MMSSLDEHLQVFRNDPEYLLAIVFWLTWYLLVQRRAIQESLNAAARQAHQRRALTAVLTAISAVIFLPVMAMQSDAQHVKTELNGDFEQPSADPITAQADDYIYSMLGQMANQPGNTAKITSQFEGYKEAERLTVVDLTESKTQFKSHPEAAAGLLELLKNVPYAAHGYIFPRASLRGFFQHCAWYKPTQANILTVQKQLNHNERVNIATISKLQQEIGHL